MIHLWIPCRRPDGRSLKVEKKEPPIKSRSKVRARVMAPFWLGAGVQIEADTEIGPNCIIGDGAVIRSGCRLKDCVVWDGVEVPANTVLENAIVHDGGVLKIPNTSR